MSLKISIINFIVKFILVWTILLLIGLFITCLFGTIYNLFGEFYNFSNLL